MNAASTLMALSRILRMIVCRHIGCGSKISRCVRCRQSTQLSASGGGGSLVFTPAGPVEERSCRRLIQRQLRLCRNCLTQRHRTATPAPSEPYGIITAPRGVNIRSGPGTVYPVVDSAEFGDDDHIVGRSADGLWWPRRRAYPQPTGLVWPIMSMRLTLAMCLHRPCRLLATPVPTATPQPTAVPTAHLYRASASPPTAR